MHRSFNLLQEEIIGSSKDNSLCSGLTHAFEEHVFPVTDSLFVDSFTSSEIAGLKGLFTFNICKRNNNLGSSVVGDSLQIIFGYSSDGNDTSLDEVFKSEIINTSGAEHDIGT